MFTPFAYFASGEVPFSPTEIANLRCWWDAQTGLTLSGTDVIQWADQSGNGFFATQSVVGDRPALSSSIAAINNYNAVRFDSANTEFMNIVDSIGGSKPWCDDNINNTFTMFVVTNQVSVTGGHYGTYISQGDNSRRSVSWGPQTFNLAVLNFGTDNYAAGGARIPAPTGFSVDNWYTSTINWSDWANRSTTQIRVNGAGQTVEVWGSAPATPTLNNPRLGRFLDPGVDAHLNAFVAELIVYNRNLTLAEKEQVEGYLKTKYGHYA